MKFKFGYAKCGFKKTGNLDLALIYSDTPCTYAGVFTDNKVRAFCVDENKSSLKKKNKIKLIVVNAGNANACTGKAGVLAVKKTKKLAAHYCNIRENEILVSSTGVIGIPLDLNKMEHGLKEASRNLSVKNFKYANEAILTTDSYKKIFIKKTQDFSLLAFAKGAGMIHPNMATMLCYILTDLQISQSLLQSTLKEVVDQTFNIISVDGDKSTNDMVILLSENSTKKEVKSKNDPIFKDFKKELLHCCMSLARDIVMDGEGATKIFNVTIKNARSEKDAKKIARYLTTSNLFKCAIFGSDPNWGRAMARIGDSGVNIDQNKITLVLNKICVFKKGTPVSFDKNKLAKDIKKQKEVFVTVDLNLGKSIAIALGSDLGYEYVKCNSEYFS